MVTCLYTSWFSAFLNDINLNKPTNVLSHFPQLYLFEPASVFLYRHAASENVSSQHIFFLGMEIKTDSNYIKINKHSADYCWRRKSQFEIEYVRNNYKPYYIHSINVALSILKIMKALLMHIQFVCKLESIRNLSKVILFIP